MASKIELRKTLADLYGEELSIRRLVSESGLDSSHINFSASAANVWFGVLNEAEKSGKINILLQIVKDEYGNNPEFVNAYEEYCHPHTQDEQDRFDEHTPTSLPNNQTRKSESTTLRIRPTQSSSLFPIPSHWFRPQILRRWLWENRNHLLEDTMEAFSEMVGADTNDEYTTFDNHAVVSRIILNRNYLEIVNALDRADLSNFIIFAITQQWNQGTLAEIKFKNFSQVKRVIKEHFDPDNLKPQVSLWSISQHIVHCINQINTNSDFAGQLGGYRTPEATRQLLEGCLGIIEQAQLLYRILVEFCTELIKICCLDIEYVETVTKLSLDDYSWKIIEVELSSHCAKLLTTINTTQWCDLLGHINYEIESFVNLCYVANNVEDKERNTTAVITHTEHHSTHSVEFLKGQLVELLSTTEQYQDWFRNVSSRRSGFAITPQDKQRVTTLVNNAKQIASILTDDTLFLPELVRVVSLTYGINSIELDVIAISIKQEYRVIYTDENLMHKLAPMASECLAYSKSDNDFWLFPPPRRPKSSVLNPILIARLHTTERHLLYLALQVESIE